MLNPNNPDAQQAFGLDDERWANYTPYEKALVDLQYKVKQSDGGQTLHETGPSKEAVISLDPSIVIESGYASDILDNTATPLENARQGGAGILKQLAEAEDVYIEFSSITQSEIQAIVSPSQYSDA